VKKIESCRVCGGRTLDPILDLGALPLANSLVSVGDPPEERFPLEVVLCRDCALSSLSVVIPPEKIYRHYRYRSSMSRTFAAHCDQLVEDAAARLDLKPGAFVIEIASNDGVLLDAFSRRGFRVLGVDPAENLVRIARERGRDAMAAFWSAETAQRVVEEYGRADLIVGCNVMAHCPDLGDILDGIAIATAPGGHFIMEVPYLLDLVEKHEFDTIYHEHLSYFLVHPLRRLFERIGWRVEDIQRIAIHGGGIRATAGPGPESLDVAHFLKAETDARLCEPAGYAEFVAWIRRISLDLRTTLETRRSAGRTIWGFGASAKGSTLLNFAGIGPDLVEAIIDDTPEKQGLLTPGNRIPVVAREELDRQRPDDLLILAWNFVDEVREKTRSFAEQGGTYIVPVPSVSVLD
jgi:novobiocin biosynthesis protein NovU/D-mycarose 3-C-methyltransferase